MCEQLNFAADLKLEMIEYPGCVINIDNMLDTLGGITKISQVLSGDQKQLELNFHPKNPFMKPTCSNLSVGCSGLLLSIKLRRSKSDPTRPPKCIVRIIGRVNRSFAFDTLCDFQFLPLFKNPELKRLEYGLNELLPKSVIDTEYFNQVNARLFCLPQSFARSDTVFTNIFRKDTQDDGLQKVLGVSTKSSTENRDIVSFNMIDTFPTRPDPQIVKRLRVKHVSDEQMKIVKNLFDMCPIWTRIALLYESGLSNDKIKCITPSLAYYFSTGPWRTMYVRYGYDPRKDFKSAHYQTFDFRLRFRSGVAEFVSNRKDLMKKKMENPYEPPHVLAQDVDYPYLEENKLPRSRQCILRYCDVRIPKIQEMLEKIPTPLTGATCNEFTGWLPMAFDAQVRQIISNSIKELLRNHYRKEQLNEDCELDSVVEQMDDVEEDETTMNDSASDGEAEPEELDDEQLQQMLVNMEVDIDNDNDNELL